MTAEQEAILKVIPKTGIRVDDLYADLRKQMRPEFFRRACEDLYRAGVLVFGGGLPCARKGRAVVVVNKGVRHDLANGDWLIPGVSCQVVQVNNRSLEILSPSANTARRVPGVPCDEHGNKVRWPEKDGVML